MKSSIFATPARIVKAPLKLIKKLAMDGIYPVRRGARLRRFENFVSNHKGPQTWIYSEGKNGTSSLFYSLLRQNPDFATYHFHYLSDQNLIAYEKGEKDRFHWTSEIHKHALMSRTIKKSIQDGIDLKNVKIISAVRDPIAGHISSFFEILYADSGLPFTTLNSWTDNEIAEKLTAIFYQKRLTGNGLWWFERRLNWFEEELFRVFGIDIYETEFNKETGYQIYAGWHPHTLVLKTESLNRCADDAVRRFLGLDVFEIQKVNTADHKRYARIYKVFLDHVQIPEWVLEKAYGSKLMRHFYTEQEIKAFKNKWLRTPNAREVQAS